MINLFIIGFMGCGKTTTHNLIKQKTKLKTLDTDSEIEKQTKLSVNQIFTNFGETYFRTIETNLLKQIETQNGIIVATGGGTLTKKRNLNILNKTSKIVFFDTSFELCFARIKQSNRPLVNKLNLKELKQLFTNRRAFYEQIANLTIKESHNLPIIKKFQQTLNFFNKCNHILF